MSEQKSMRLSDWYYIKPMETEGCDCSFDELGVTQVCNSCEDNWYGGPEEPVEHMGCELDCRMCQGYPELYIPLLTGQKKVLRNILKDLWANIDFVLGPSREKSYEKEVRIEELHLLLTKCNFTRYYLDWDCGDGWSALLLTTITDIIGRSSSRRCESNCGLYSLCFDCLEQDQLNEDRMQKKSKSKKRKLLPHGE